MKIRITKVDNREEETDLTLAECGFKVGDVVEVEGKFRDGSLLIIAPGNKEFGIEFGDNVSINEGEFEVVE
ncbi:hypothetical protein KMB89_gp16 [Citrobacter phage HCF1]|uniref:Uncharacterized protein n=1 Tax=Citrobacter phage HCF1 TaxID=2849700 RepID=A0ABX6D3L6_9CAUD|nr:hypothetical protein KMB89_gp16 [Citrobacter phage HCF1]